MADKYLLKVTAGPSYTEQQSISVNTEESTTITSPALSANLRIRVQNYRGLPASSPKTSPYFVSDPHKHDLYSLAFNFTLKKEDINGADLVFGNDFDHPIRDKLPPGFQQAFNLVKWFVDPGLYGDVHADEPYLYGPLLSSMNVVNIGGTAEEGKSSESDSHKDGELEVISEGATGSGEAVRKESGLPADAAARKKHFLTASHLKAFTFEKGREYANDFFNPYLDFNDFALKLPGWGVIPGITMPIITYWDGQPLRYVMKNRKTDETLLVIIFTLIPKDKVEAEEGKPQDGGKAKAEEQQGGEAEADDDVD